ncbi:MAG: hypothetical protein ACYDC1_02715 [Limisphaerales bacterium]
MKAGLPTLDAARRRLLAELEAARGRGVRLVKVVHGWGSGGEGGVLAVGLRKSLRLRVKEGRALSVVPGERFSSDTLEGRGLAERHPSVRRDADFNRANPGITVVELVLPADVAGRPSAPVPPAPLPPFHS